MQGVQPGTQFEGMLIDRSAGRYGLGAPSSKELMEKVPEWPAFIRSITGWQRVEPGTLTLDCVKPLPLPTLENVVCLGTEPEDLFMGYSPKYARLLREKRGPRRFYGAFAHTGQRTHVAAVSQQATPAVEHRLEVYSDEKLRDLLQVRTMDVVYVDVFHKDDWFELLKAGP